MRRTRLTPRQVRERTWERGGHLQYSIHGKELGSILLRHRIKKCYIRIKRPYDSGFITDSKISTLDSRLKQLRIRMPDSADTC